MRRRCREGRCPSGPAVRPDAHRGRCPDARRAVASPIPCARVRLRLQVVHGPSQDTATDSEQVHRFGDAGAERRRRCGRLRKPAVALELDIDLNELEDQDSLRSVLHSCFNVSVARKQEFYQKKRFLF